MTPALTRRQWLAAATASLAGLPLASRAGAAGRLQVLAITFRGKTDVERGFEQHVSSRKLPMDIAWRDLGGDANRLPAVLDEIRAARPDLVYTAGTTVTLGVVGPHDGVVPGRHITDIPVLFTMVAAPVQSGIVPRLQGHGRNLTGVSHVVAMEAQVRAIAAYRRFDTLGVLSTPTERNAQAALDELHRLGHERGFRTVERCFRLDGGSQPCADGAADLVRELKDAGAQWLYLPPDSFLGTVAESTIVPAAMRLGLPTFASTERLMRAGALSGLVSHDLDVGRFAAAKAARILLERQAAASLPVDLPRRFSYQIRMPAAQALKLPPPQPIMGYAELITL